jgi:hypothetical protein
VPLPESAEFELRRVFAEPLWASARERLPALEDLPAEAPFERVLRAVVRLADGSLEALSHYASSAREDWRDVLYWAEHPRDDSDPKSYEELRRRLGLPDA